jgi:hypothetical protein
MRGFQAITICGSLARAGICYVVRSLYRPAFLHGDKATEDIWSIYEGTKYPKLVWQIPKGDFLCPDGITIEEDFDFFLDHYGDSNCDSSNGYCDGTDLDFSGTVDINDLEILINNWLKENP